VLDIRRRFSIGIPVASFLAFLAAAIISPSYYRSHVRKHEVGWQEQGTVICLAPAVIVGIVMLYRRPFSSRWLTAWVALLTLGALYFGGEECSWGQNYVGWSTPERWSVINDQHETNLHNTAGVFDHLPRALLTAAAACCVIIPFAVGQRAERWRNDGRPIGWILPTSAVVPSAILSLLVGVPQKFHGLYDKTPNATDWFSEMFFAGRHSEMKEYFLAMFILMYMWSMASRLGRVAHESVRTGSSAQPDSVPASIQRPAA
jgi:hypothetical protein